jgi:hypothetical protein
MRKILSLALKQSSHNRGVVMVAGVGMQLAECERKTSSYLYKTFLCCFLPLVPLCRVLGPIGSKINDSETVEHVSGEEVPTMHDRVGLPVPGW